MRNVNIRVVGGHRGIADVGSQVMLLGYQIGLGCPSLSVIWSWYIRMKLKYKIKVKNVYIGMKH